LWQNCTVSAIFDAAVFSPILIPNKENKMILIIFDTNYGKELNHQQTLTKTS
jgi:hypothetical protein